MLFIEKHGDAWESSKKSGSWFPKARESPSTEGKEAGLVAGEEGFALGEEFNPTLMSSWRDRRGF